MAFLTSATFSARTVYWAIVYFIGGDDLYQSPAKRATAGGSRDESYFEPTWLPARRRKVRAFRKACFAHGNSAARMAKPSGMNTRAGPGRTTMASPANRTKPPAMPITAFRAGGESFLRRKAR